MTFRVARKTKYVTGKYYLVFGSITYVWLNMLTWVVMLGDNPYEKSIWIYICKHIIMYITNGSLSVLGLYTKIMYSNIWENFRTLNGESHSGCMSNNIQTILTRTCLTFLVGIFLPTVRENLSDKYPIPRKSR